MANMTCASVPQYLKVLKYSRYEYTKQAENIYTKVGKTDFDQDPFKFRTDLDHSSEMKVRREKAFPFL